MRTKTPPIEKLVLKLLNEKEAYEEIGWALRIVGDKIDPSGDLALSCQVLSNEASSEIEGWSKDLGVERRERVRDERLKDKWASPSCRDGWLCPSSPTGACSYEGGDWDSCDYCGFPEERK